METMIEDTDLMLSKCQRTWKADTGPMVDGSDRERERPYRQHRCRLPLAHPIGARCTCRYCGEQR